MLDEKRHILPKAKCSQEHLQAKLTEVIEEIYINLETIINNAYPGLTVRDNEGTVIVPNVDHLVCSETTVEDLDGNAARIKPSQQVKVVQSPSGGISASTTTTLNSGTCTEFYLVSGALNETTTTITVYNIDDTAIPGDAFGIAWYNFTDQKWYSNSCCWNTTISGPFTQTDPGDEPTPPPGGGAGEDPDFDCTVCNDGTYYYQYDIQFNGFSDNPTGYVPPWIPQCDHCEAFINGETFRVTYFEPPPANDPLKNDYWGPQCEWRYRVPCPDGVPYCCEGIFVRLIFVNVSTLLRSRGVGTSIFNTQSSGADSGQHLAVELRHMDDIFWFSKVLNGGTSPSDCNQNGEVLELTFGGSALFGQTSMECIADDLVGNAPWPYAGLTTCTVTRVS